MTRKTLTGLLLAASTMAAGTLSIATAQDDKKPSDLEAAVAAELGEAEKPHDHEHTPTTVHSGEKAFKLDDKEAYPDPDGFENMSDRVSYAYGRMDGSQIPAAQPDLNVKTYGEGIKKGLAEDNQDYALGYSQGFELARRFLAQRDTESMDMEAFIEGLAAAIKEKDEGKSIGYLIGNSYREQDIELDGDSYIEGVDESLLKPEPVAEGEEPKPVKTKLTEEQVQETLGAYQAYMMEKLKQEAIQKGKDYIDSLKAEDGWKKTESGIAYRVAEAGAKGAKSPDENDICKMDYELRLLDGDKAGSILQTTFDTDRTVDFSADRVIEGWGEVLQLMKVGETLETVIPHNLGYREFGSPPNIPPYATLIFKMKMHSMEEVSNEPAKPEPKPLPKPGE